ncbi:MAG: hypothetical protein AOA66_0165 [Candidatus Bathyarchaeota archaeon BA2]|nr:MAG: hypothetical protein AOA66_0165 [Candidatus Bathyarchaeota archaeon BA2]
MVNYLQEVFDWSGKTSMYGSDFEGVYRKYKELLRLAREIFETKVLKSKA